MSTPKRGRPKTIDSGRGTRIVTVYLPAELLALVDQVRGRERRSDWIRRAIQDQARREQPG